MGFGLETVIHLSTVVVVGDRFDPAIVKADQFFGGLVDSGQLLIGPVAQAGYDSGRCAFALNPARIDLKVQSPAVMPEELCSAANQLAQSLDAVRSAVTITGIGLNCDWTFAPSQRTGQQISNDLADLDVLKVVTGAASLQLTTATVQHAEDGLTYAIRIDPEAAGEGRHQRPSECRPRGTSRT